ncbi:sensor histidine kinase [Kitasatospora sp. NPDC092948]|uniref:sensor histidine kinase n=1 Tax=Kitasatospora sp. NPDC092948 TaxID=3364088 RepID=UPI0037FC9740
MTGRTRHTRPAGRRHGDGRASGDGRLPDGLDGAAASSALLARLMGGIPPRRLALALLCVIMAGFVALSVVDILTCSAGPLQVAVLTVDVLLVAGLQVVHCLPFAAGLRWRFGRWTLALQAALAFLPPYLAGWNTGAMMGFVGASLLLALAGRAAWIGYGVFLLALVPSGPVLGMPSSGSVYLVVANGLSSLVLYGITRLVELIDRLYEARSAMATRAVEQERQRFARDLHDLLGYSLSTITVKCELTSALIKVRPEQALSELTDVLAISRQALADVRTVARGYREMSLLTEIESARGVLAAGGIRAHVNVSAPAPSGEANTVLATVLRESVTNLLRHSKAEVCRIEFTAQGPDVCLLVANDGVRTERAVTRERGTGLANLADRIAAVGGLLEVGAAEGSDWFRLTARVPSHI